MYTDLIDEFYFEYQGGEGGPFLLDSQIRPSRMECCCSNCAGAGGTHFGSDAMSLQRLRREGGDLRWRNYFVNIRACDCGDCAASVAVRERVFTYSRTVREQY